jgi:peptidoglycan/xylan/chitin deacetylase (PgdA/CDA1 family)
MVSPLKALWRVRDLLPPSARQQLRTLADGVLGPVGSVVGGTSGRPEVGLTFDDGPDPRWTPPLLDLLAERGVTATFFLLANRAQRYPSVVHAIAEAGHELALHGFDHTRLTTLDRSDALRRVAAARAVLEDLGQCEITWFRPPYGAQSLPLYLGLRRSGLDVVVWGPYAEDWVDGTPREVADRARRNSAAGSIVLLHDGLELPPGEPRPRFDRTEAFRLILDDYAAAGQRPVPVGELVRPAGPRRTAWFRP